MLQNCLYAGKVFIPEFKDEDAQIVLGVHEAIVSEELFDKAQRIINGNRKHKKCYDKLNDEAPLRAMITCRQCGGKLTSSVSKG